MDLQICGDLQIQKRGEMGSKRGNKGDIFEIGSVEGRERIWKLGNKGVASNWPPLLYQAKATVSRTGGERVTTKADNKELIGNTSTDEADPITANDKGDQLTGLRGDKGVGDDDAHSKEQTMLSKSPAKAAVADETNLMEGIEGQGENQVDETDKDGAMEQGKYKNPKSGTSASIVLDSVCKSAGSKGGKVGGGSGTRGVTGGGIPKPISKK
ncbi:unnamed protein product [Cochlearia groenlandica]